jgi:hypothetical protein
MDLNMLSLLLRSLSVIVSDPALGHKGDAVRAALVLAAVALEKGAEGRAALAELTEQIKRMVEENREPTDDEWASLKSRSDAAHAILQGDSDA